MKSIYLYIVGLLVVVGVVSIPLVVKQKVDDSIKSEKQILLTKGLELTLTKEEGYLESMREFDLKVVNAKQFRDFLFDELVKMNSASKNVTEVFKKLSEREIRPAIDGTLFKGFIKNSNLLPGDLNIEFYLARLSDVAMNEVAKDKKLAGFMTPLLNKKTITFLVILDSDQNVKEISMRDIDHTIDDKRQVINFKLKDNKLNINSAERLSGVYTLGEQAFKTSKKGTNKSFLVQTEGVNYKFDYLNQYDNEARFSLDNLLIEDKQYNRDSSFTMGHMSIESMIKPVDDTMLEANVGYSLSAINLNDQNKFKLDAMDFKLNFKGIDKKGVITFAEGYNKILLASQISGQMSNNETQNIAVGLKKIINSGFNMNVESSLEGLSFEEISLGNIDLSIEGQLKENTYNMSASAAMNALKINGVLTMDEGDLKNLSKLNLKINDLALLAKKDGDKVVFNFEVKEGHIVLNGTKL